MNKKVIGAQAHNQEEADQNKAQGGLHYDYQSLQESRY
jgi:hypothetical protein